MSTPLAIFLACAITAALCVGLYALWVKLRIRHLTTNHAKMADLAAEAAATMRRRDDAQTQPLAPWEYTLGANGLNGIRIAGEVMVCSVSQEGRESSTFNFWCMGKGLEPEKRHGSRATKALAERAAERAALLFGWNVDGRPVPAADAAFVVAQGQAAALGCKLSDDGDKWFLHCGECQRMIAGGPASAMSERIPTLKDEWARWTAADEKGRATLVGPCECKRVGKLRAV